MDKAYSTREEVIKDLMDIPISELGNKIADLAAERIKGKDKLRDIPINVGSEITLGAALKIITDPSLF